LRETVEGYDEKYFRRNEERVSKPLFRAELDHLVRLLALKHGDRVLDVGCATGTYLRVVERICGLENAYGVEPNEFALVSCLAQAKVVIGRAECLPFGDNFFDRVYLTHVIGHVEDTRGAAREMLRVLKPGGRALILTPDKLHVCYMRPFKVAGYCALQTGSNYSPSLFDVGTHKADA